MTKPNAIEEIIKDRLYFLGQANRDDTAKDILAALDAAGLAVVPKEATDDMVIAGGEAQQQSIGSWGEPKVVLRAAIPAFNPTTWKSKT